MADAKQLYSRLLRTPFPDLGKRVGDFVLYDSLVAGYASRLAKGESLDSAAAGIIADEETLKVVATLRAKKPRTRDEQAFLDYFELLEAIRSAIIAQATNR